MDIQRTLLILNAFVVIIAFIQAFPIEEIENPEEINDGANAFDQHNLRQLSPRRRTPIRRSGSKSGSRSKPKLGSGSGSRPGSGSGTGSISGGAAPAAALLGWAGLNLAAGQQGGASGLGRAEVATTTAAAATTTQTTAA